jgi:hypothetical protein
MAPRCLSLCSVSALLFPLHIPGRLDQQLAAESETRVRVIDTHQRVFAEITVCHSTVFAAMKNP